MSSGVSALKDDGAIVGFGTERAPKVPKWNERSRKNPELVLGAFLIQPSGNLPAHAPPRRSRAWAGWQRRSWQVERWGTRRFTEVTFLCESGACIRRKPAGQSPDPCPQSGWRNVT